MNACAKREEHRVYFARPSARNVLDRHTGTPSSQSRKVNVQRRNSRRDQFRVLIENADEQDGEERDQYPDKHGISDSDLRHKSDSIPGALVQTGTVVAS